MQAERRFQDRRDAGRALTPKLEGLADQRPVVLGIARGGIVVAAEIATALNAPLDIVVVRKLGYPGHPEAGFGAIGEDGVIVPQSLERSLASDPSLDSFRDVVEATRAEVEAGVERYLGGRRRPPLDGATAIVVDDGIATGFTFVAALEVARRRGAARRVAAAPVASREGARMVAEHCDESHILEVPPEGSFAVSLHYVEFGQVDDEAVAELLK